MKRSRALLPSRSHRRGAAIIYFTVLLVVMLAFVSLAVDYGRAQLVKTELQRAADAAVRYGVTGLHIDVNTAQQYAIDAAKDNKADGTPVVLDKTDIEFGVWESAGRTFTLLSGDEQQSATAMRVTAHRLVPTLFLAALGRSNVSVSAQSIAVIGRDKTFNIPATGSPWLAGMPNGSRIPRQNGNPMDAIAPSNSPTAVTGVTITPGSHLNFRNTTGQTGDSTTNQTYGLDGDIVRNQIQQSAVNGINSTKAPLNALMGIFLDDSQPSSSSMAASLDFSTSGARNFNSFSPKLKQVFFIGDGVNDNNRLQDFVVPAGATRLYLGVMDENGFWWDNVGSISTTIYDTHINLVR